ncbi:unnamed protein product, partial [Prorocentrum cordatum]
RRPHGCWSPRRWPCPTWSPGWGRAAPWPRTRSRARLLQVGSGARAEEVAGLRDSAAALSAALGPQWNGDRLEADAKQKTDALLQGIAGHKAFGALNNMLNMLR